MMDEKTKKQLMKAIELEAGLEAVKHMRDPEVRAVSDASYNVIKTIHTYNKTHTSNEVIAIVSTSLGTILQSVSSKEAQIEVIMRMLQALRDEKEIIDSVDRTRDLFERIKDEEE